MNQEIQVALTKRQRVIGNLADIFHQDPQQLEETKFNWGNCMSVKRQFPVNVATEQISKSPDLRLKQQQNYYIEEVLHRPSELKKMQ